jgi:hypothetical protein
MNNPHILIEMKYNNGLFDTIIYISLAHKGKEIEGSYEIEKV